MTVEEQLEIIKAYLDGEIIETAWFEELPSNADWGPVFDENHRFDFNNLQYRIKEKTGKYQKHVNSIKKAFELDDEESETIKTVEEQIKERMDRLDKRFDSIEQKLNEIIENNKSTKVDWEYTPIDVPFYNYQLPVDTPDPCKNCTNHPSNGGSGICHCTLGNNITYKIT